MSEDADTNDGSADTIADPAEAVMNSVYAGNLDGFFDALDDCEEPADTLSQLDDVSGSVLDAFVETSGPQFYGRYASHANQTTTTALRTRQRIDAVINQYATAAPAQPATDAAAVMAPVMQGDLDGFFRALDRCTDAAEVLSQLDDVDGSVLDSFVEASGQSFHDRYSAHPNDRTTAALANARARIAAVIAADQPAAANAGQQPAAANAGQQAAAAVDQQAADAAAERPLPPLPYDVRAAEVVEYLNQERANPQDAVEQYFARLQASDPQFVQHLRQNVGEFYWWERTRDFSEYIAGANSGDSFATRVMDYRAELDTVVGQLNVYPYYGTRFDAAIGGLQSFICREIEKLRDPGVAYALAQRASFQAIWEPFAIRRRNQMQDPAWAERFATEAARENRDLFRAMKSGDQLDWLYGGGVLILGPEAGNSPERVGFVKRQQSYASGTVTLKRVRVGSDSLTFAGCPQDLKDGLKRAARRFTSSIAIRMP